VGVPVFLAVIVAALPGSVLGDAQHTAYTPGAPPHGGFNKVEVLSGTVQRTRQAFYDGPIGLHLRAGGPGNSYARGIFHVDWREGEDVWYGAAFRLPRGFTARMQGQVDLVRWDNFGRLGTDDDRSGVVIHRDGLASLVRERFGVENVDLGAPFALPEGRWFWLEVHQVLSRTDGRALSEAYVDGASVSTSTVANTYGRGVDRVRFGLVALDAERQRASLELDLDRATAGPLRAGPLRRPQSR
jgi:hypothetical protein